MCNCGKSAPNTTPFPAPNIGPRTATLGTATNQNILPPRSLRSNVNPRLGTRPLQPVRGYDPSMTRHAQKQ